MTFAEKLRVVALIDRVVGDLKFPDPPVKADRDILRFLDSISTIMSDGDVVACTMYRTSHGIQLIAAANQKDDSLKEGIEKLRNYCLEYVNEPTTEGKKRIKKDIRTFTFERNWRAIRDQAIRELSGIYKEFKETVDRLNEKMDRINSGLLWLPFNNDGVDRAHRISGFNRDLPYYEKCLAVLEYISTKEVNDAIDAKDLSMICLIVSRGSAMTARLEEKSTRNI
jgi:hypothetical protein